MGPDAVRPRVTVRPEPSSSSGPRPRRPAVSVSGAVSDNPVPVNRVGCSREPPTRFHEPPRSNVFPPPPAWALRPLPVPPVGLAAFRQGLGLGLAAHPFARPSVYLAVPLRSMTGSITRTIRSVHLSREEGKRRERNPEVVPTNLENVPSSPGLVPSAAHRCPQAIPKRDAQQWPGTGAPATGAPVSRLARRPSCPTAPSTRGSSMSCRPPSTLCPTRAPAPGAP